MPISIVAILISGGIYCPLTPSHPQQRLAALVKQTSARCVLVHDASQDKFDSGAIVNITEQLISGTIDFDRLSPVCVSGDDVAYIIFTSGSTGEPKGAQILHRNFTTCIWSLVVADLFTQHDNVLQTTPCSFDIHVQEILGSLMIGATLIMLQPHGNLDSNYYLQTVDKHQVTYVISVPTHLTALCNLVEQERYQLARTLRILCSIGESLTTSLARRLMPLTCRLVNVYSPAETTIAATAHEVTSHDLSSDSSPIPLGYLLRGYTCQVVDEYEQSVVPGQLGELYIGGHGVFHGYFHRPDLTEAAISTLDSSGDKYYRTGDLVRVDSYNGLLQYVGRKDFQVKLRGQRVELGEIEATLLATSTSITNCIVIKVEHLSSDHLVAYVETMTANYMDLRDACISRLPLYMVPSLFMLLDKFPTNSNGKIDRQALPPPDFTLLSLSNNKQQARTEIEQRVHSLWCQVLTHLDSISTCQSFYSLGGNSLLFMRLFQLYQTELKSNVSIGDLFRHATIADHARLVLEQRNSSPSDKETWKSLNLHEGPASFAQTRIYLDERIRFSSSSTPTYHMPYVFQIQSNCLVFLDKLQRALAAVVNKQQILRTRLFLNKKEQVLRQELLHSTDKLLSISVVDEDNEEDLIQILVNEETNPSLFDLEHGHVFRCRAIKRNSSSISNNRLMSGDIIIFNFHHVAFDGFSFPIFLRDLQLAYATDGELEPCQLHYIDYAVHEQQMDLTEAREFWQKQLNDFSGQMLPLLYDKIPPDAHTRSGRGSTVSFDLSQELVDRMFTFAAEHEATPFQMGLAAFCAFLFKLTQTTGLCVGTLSANRTRSELENIVGFFVNTVPYRLTLEPHMTFAELLEDVKRLAWAILPYSHLPYQEIMDTVNSTIQTLFSIEDTHEQGGDLVVLSDDSNRAVLRPLLAACLQEKLGAAAKFDWTCHFYHDAKTRSIAVSFNVSLDVFERATLEKMARRFDLFLWQLFASKQPLCKYSLLLNEEHEIMHKLNDSQVNLSDIDCIHHEIIRQAQKHPQQVAVVLDDQSLTYSEILHNAQRLGLHLIDMYNVQPGDVIAQCIERSIEMIIGILAILMCGGVYCPLSADLPSERLCALTEQTQAKFILVHQITEKLVPLHDNKVNIEKDILLLPLNDIISPIRLERQSHVDDIVYIIFTSGSAGTPKGVPTSHRNFITCLRALEHLRIMTCNDTVLQRTAVTWDIHLQDIFGTLCLGGQLVLLRPHGHLDMSYMISTMHRHEVTFLITVPTVFVALAQHLKDNEDRLTCIHCLCSIGEPLPPQTVSTFVSSYLQPTAQFYNFYGQTEASLLSTYHCVAQNDLLSSTIPIGRPIYGHECRILDEYLQPVIPGRLGELFIGGDGLFQSYLHRPDLTEATLIEFDNGKRYYRTGDLVRIDPSTGLLHYVERLDFQVKLRGQRIELAEIELTIRGASPFVKNCVVVKQIDDDNESFLTAHVMVLPTKTVDNDLHKKIMADCRQQLPSYMVPSAWSWVDSLPTNANGKVNRKELPLIERAKHQHTLRSPATLLEEQLQTIFAKAFRLPKCYRCDQFI